MSKFYRNTATLQLTTSTNVNRFWWNKVYLSGIVNCICRVNFKWICEFLHINSIHNSQNFVTSGQNHQKMGLLLSLKTFFILNISLWNKLHHEQKCVLYWQSNFQGCMPIISIIIYFLKYVLNFTILYRFQFNWSFWSFYIQLLDYPYNLIYLYCLKFRKNIEPFLSKYDCS